MELLRSGVTDPVRKLLNLAERSVDTKGAAVSEILDTCDTWLQEYVAFNVAQYGGNERASAANRPLTD